MFNWKFIALESNEESFEYAKQNIEANNFQDFIELYKKDSFIDVVEADVSFSMCNPPFYSDLDDIKASSSFKPDKPVAVHRYLIEDYFGKRE